MNKWRYVSLGDLCDVTAGGTPSRAVASNFGGDIPWVKIGDMLQGQVFATEESLSRSGLEDSAAKVLPAGTVLMSIFATIGRTAILGIDAATNQAIVGIRPRDTNIILPHYLRRFLDSQTPALERRARGVAQANINSAILKSLPVPLPTPPEQRRIAKILDKADALRTKRCATLDMLAKLTQSIFLDMFGDPTTNPKGWPATKLSELISVGLQNGLYKPASDYGTGIPILRIDSFYDGVVTGLASLKRVRISDEEKALYGLRPGEIVINRVNSREYLGKSALIPSLPEPIVFESNMMRFGVDRARISPVFLIHLLQTKHVRAHILRSAKDAVNQSSINQQDVKGIPVILPPLPQQELFAERLRGLETLSNWHRASLTELDALFASLQYRAFRGEL